MRVISLNAVVVVLGLLLASQASAACKWQVKPNGKLTTRPAYTLTDGVLGKKIVARAPVGATCDLRRPTKQSGKDLWASYDSTDKVALCTKR